MALSNQEGEQQASIRFVAEAGSAHSGKDHKSKLVEEEETLKKLRSDFVGYVSLMGRSDILFTLYDLSVNSQ